MYFINGLKNRILHLLLHNVHCIAYFGIKRSGKNTIKEKSKLLKTRFDIITINKKDILTIILKTPNTKTISEIIVNLTT